MQPSRGVQGRTPKQAYRRSADKLNNISRWGERDLFKEIRDIIGSFNSRCGAMKGTQIKLVTEDKEVPEIWKKHTEVLYRRYPNVNYIFVEYEYEDEPEVLESEVKDALQHISNRKAAGGEYIGLPNELLKAGGDDAVTVCMKEEVMTVRF